jgi:hypothetical protein
MTDLEARLASWVDSGLITEEQARAIRAAERSHVGEPEPSLVATALGYLGASVALVGGVVAASRHWSAMGTASRLALSGGATLLLLAAGWIVRRRDHSALRSLDGFLWFLAAAGAAFTAGLAVHELIDAESRSIFLAAGLAMTAVGALLWKLRPGPLQEIAVMAGLAVMLESLLRYLPGPPDFHGLPLWGLGAVWGLLAWGAILRPGRISLALAGAALLLGAQILSFGWRGAGLALGIGTAVALLAASVRLGSMLVLGFGAAGILLFLPQIVFEYLGDSLGAPLALLVCGLVLLGAAFLAARLRGTVRRAQGPEDGRGNRTRAALAAAGVAIAVGAFVWGFGVAPLPEYPSLAAHPDPSIPGRVAFLRWWAGPPCLYVVPAAGGEARRLRCTDDDGDDPDWFGEPLGWTEEGLIVVHAFGASGPRAIVLDPETGRTLERIPIPEPLFARTPPSDRGVRADGGRLLVRSSGRTATLGIAPPDGRPIEVTRVSGPPDFAFWEAVWSPDGEWILVRDSNQNLLVLPARENARPRLLSERVSGPVAWHVPGIAAGTVDLDSLRAAPR